MTDIFVSTTGNDTTGNGTAGAPYLSWQKGHDVANPGDVILISPTAATYNPVGTVGCSITRPGPVTMRGNGGVAHMWCGQITNSSRFFVGLEIRASNWTFEDLRIEGLVQTVTGDRCKGVYLKGDAGAITGNTLRRIESDNHGGSGIEAFSAVSNTLLEDCDFHHNYDPLGNNPTPGGDADGMTFNSVTGTGNLARRCRAWSNSDDGFDVWQSAPFTFEGCWSFYNGFIPNTSTPSGDGTGFKLGRNSAGEAHRLTNCLAAENGNHGFDNNQGTGNDVLYNNTSASNGDIGFRFPDGAACILRNNLSYNPHQGTHASLHANVVHDHNSWDTAGVTVAAGDFVSTNSSSLYAARGTGGALPATSFMQLVSSSDLIDAGVNVGLSYIGPAPDMGAFESAFTTPAVTAVFLGIRGPSEFDFWVDVIEAAHGDEDPTSSGLMEIVSRFGRVHANITWPLTTPVQASIIEAFLGNMRGRRKPAKIPNVKYRVKLGTASGAWVVNGTHSRGAESVAISGGSGTFAAGDWVQITQINGVPRAYLVGSHVSGSISIAPPLHETTNTGKVLKYLGDAAGTAWIYDTMELISDVGPAPVTAFGQPPGVVAQRTVELVSARRRTYTSIIDWQ